jgi:hypothetical protein
MFVLRLGFSLAIGVCLISLSGCASTEPAPLPPPPTPAELIGTCKYLNVFVDPENIYHGNVDRRPEEIRQEVLLRAAQLLPEHGFSIVQNRSDAYWSLYVQGYHNVQGVVSIRIALQAELKLGRELFVILIDNDEFPYRGSLGGGYQLEFLGPLDRASVQTQTAHAVKSILARESKQIPALCEARSQLAEEGWSEIEELRLQLVDEMKRVRSERAQTHQQKVLLIGVEEPGLPASVER